MNILHVEIYTFFFFNDTATTEIYTLSLHDALPICAPEGLWPCPTQPGRRRSRPSVSSDLSSASDLPQATHTIVPARSPESEEAGERSEEHTSELQSQSNLVCRLLLEKKKKITI